MTFWCFPISPVVLAILHYFAQQLREPWSLTRAKCNVITVCLHQAIIFCSRNRTNILHHLALVGHCLSEVFHGFLPFRKAERRLLLKEAHLAASQRGEAAKNEGLKALQAQLSEVLFELDRRAAKLLLKRLGSRFIGSGSIDVLWCIVCVFIYNIYTDTYIQTYDIYEVITVYCITLWFLWFWTLWRSHKYMQIQSQYIALVPAIPTKRYFSICSREWDSGANQKLDHRSSIQKLRGGPCCKKPWQTKKHL